MNRDLEVCLETQVDWEGDVDDGPYQATVKNQDWVIQVNEFPSEPMYSLFVQGRAIGDFDDWPRQWRL